MNIMFMSHEHNAGDKGGQGKISGEQGEGEGKEPGQTSPGLGPGSATLPYHHLTLADCLDPEEN